MKRQMLTILLALCASAGHGQEVKRVAATPEDFMEHMALCGYEVYTYDISSLRDSVSGFNIVIREYNKQGMIDEKQLNGFRTKAMISDFNEEDQKEIYAQKDADDLEHGIYRLSKTIAIGFSPVQSDSIENITLQASRNDASHWTLTLKPIPDTPRTIYRYKMVPYQPDTFCLDTFIPLVFYGSFWWDAKNGIIRFCGLEELTEEKVKASNYFKDSPHYYIIGAIFHK